MRRRDEIQATEGQEQAALMRWAQLNAAKWPEISLLYHVPNGGSRNALEAKHLKAQGVKPGVPDLCLPVSRGGYHGLYIELKRRGGGRTSQAQTAWLEALARQRYCASVCHGWTEAARMIAWYLEGCDSGET